MNNETSALPQWSAGAGLHWTTVFLCSFPTTFAIFSLCFLPNNHSLSVLGGTIVTLMQRSVDFQPIFNWLPPNWKFLDCLTVCAGHPFKSPSLLKSSNFFKVCSCSPKFKCFIPLLQRIFYHTRRKKKKENSNNIKHQNNVPGDLLDLLNDDMEMVQRLGNFSFALWTSGHKWEKEGKKFCFVTMAVDHFLPQNPWSHCRNYSPMCTQLSDHWPRAI